MTDRNGWIAIPNAYANRLFAAAGWDSVTLDAQHGLFDDRALIETLQVLSAPAPRRLVRLAANDPAQAGRVLDYGADGIIAPLIDTAADAARLAAACHYPPQGGRSYGPIFAALRPAAAPQVWAMIETASGLANAAAIAAVPGITGLYVGPNDLSLALGLQPGSDRTEPVVLAALQAVLDAAAASAKPAGIFCASPGYAARMAALGFGLVTIGQDAALLAAAAERTLRAFAAET